MRPNYCLATFIGIVTVVVVAQSSVSETKIYQQTRQSVILIQDATGERRGTGFIVAKDGNVYYALTAGHVVLSGQFQIQTDATVQGGERLAVESVLPLPGVDLALVQFTSSREYPVARLARDATRVTETDRIFVLGYPASSVGNPEIPTGTVTSRQPLTSGSGRAIFYDVNTEGGMSGSPVLTINGEVVGIHIGLPSQRSFREAVPIEKYWELTPSVFTSTGRNDLAAGRFPQAIASLQLVRQIIGQETPEASLVLAYAYFGLNDISRAREEARKISADNANAALLLGAIDYLEGNNRSAIENASRAAQLDRRTLGGYALSIVGLSHIAIAADNSDRDARLNITEATGLIRDDAFVYLASSCLKFRINGDIPAATADFNNATRLTSQRPGDPFLAVLTNQLQSRARTCLPENFVRFVNPPNPTNLGRYKSSAPISFGTSVTALAVSNDSRFVAVGLNNGRVVIYNLETKTEVASFNIDRFSLQVNSVAFSPNGQDIAATSSTGQLGVFNIQSGAVKYGMSDIGQSSQIVFSNNNNFLYVGSITNTMRMLNNRDGTLRTSRTDAHPGGITSLILSPDGRLVSGGADGRIRFWNPNDLTASDNNYQAHQGAVTSMAFSPDGSQIISAGVDRVVNSCNWQTGQCNPVARTNEAIGGLAVASNGQVAFSERPFLVTPENRIFLQDLSSGQSLGNLPDHRDRVVALAYTPDGRFMISGSSDQTIIIWEVR